MDANEATPPPAPLLPGRSMMERVVDHAKRHSTKLLWGLAVLLAIVTMAIALVRYRFEPLLLLFCVFFLIFYAALYLRRLLRGRLHYHHLRRGLEYAAFSSAALVSLLFFVSFAPAVGFWQVLVGAWLVLAVFAYCFYRIIVLPLDDDEHEHAAAFPPV